MIYLTVIAGLELIAIGGIVYLWFLDRRESEKRWASERRELLTRIQRPELVPIPRSQAPRATQRIGTLDEIRKVGTIAHQQASGDS